MVENHKPTKTKKNKTEVITIRVTEAEKKILVRKAAGKNLNLSKYLIEAGMNNKQRKEDILTDVGNAALLQQLCNHIAQTYGEDKFLEEWNARLWESLS